MKHEDNWRNMPTSVRIADFRNALLAMLATDAYDTPAVEAALQYMDETRSIPEWMLSIKEDLWHVRHKGIVHDTFAVTEADAINKVRYRIYGRQSVPQCEFEAVCLYNIVKPFIGDALCYFADSPSRKESANMTADDAKSRLERMLGR